MQGLTKFHTLSIKCSVGITSASELADIILQNLANFKAIVFTHTHTHKKMLISVGTHKIFSWSSIAMPQLRKAKFESYTKVPFPYPMNGHTWEPKGKFVGTKTVKLTVCLHNFVNKKSKID
jgi:hypothetical protein